MVKKKDKEVKIFGDMTKCVACKSCEIACAIEHSVSKDLYKVLKEEKLPKKRVKVSALRLSSGPMVSEVKSSVTPEKTISIHCQHCIDAPCVTACMSGAMYKDKDTSATMHDKDRCVGCWMCVMACPFGAIVRDVKDKIALKCDLCPNREDYACVVACPTGALFVGTEEEFKKMLKKKTHG